MNNSYKFKMHNEEQNEAFHQHAQSLGYQWAMGNRKDGTIRQHGGVRFVGADSDGRMYFGKNDFYGEKGYREDTYRTEITYEQFMALDKIGGEIR